MSRGWIGVDLDGTLAHYDGWNDGAPGAPIPLMVRRVQDWLRQGITVKIFTARLSVTDPAQKIDQAAKITDWCIANIGQVLEITCEKDLAMIELWDDRVVRVVKNKGLIDNSYTGIKGRLE